MDDKLTKQDIDLLVEGIEMWEKYPEMIINTYEFMKQGYIEKGSTQPIDEATQIKIKELKEQIKTRKHQAILIKYKLVKLNHVLDVEEIEKKFNKEQN
jgi:hypothetical protein